VIIEPSLVQEGILLAVNVLLEMVRLAVTAQIFELTNKKIKILDNRAKVFTLLFD